MKETKEELVSQFNDYMRQVGGRRSDWYVGISKDAKDRLFNGHGVKEVGDNWICGQASSSSDARDVEKFFLDLGLDGGDGGGDGTADEVYAYKKNIHTRP